MKRPSKYRNQPVVVDGRRFASKAEARRYGELKLLERAGEITLLELQPRFPVAVNGQPICIYVGDFLYRAPVGRLQWTVEDVKGVETPEFRLKWKLAKALNPHIVFRLIPAGRSRRAAA